MDLTKHYKEHETLGFPTDTTGGGDVIAPATNTDSYIPQWDLANSKTLKNGIPTSTFAPALGADDNYVTNAEKAALHTQNTDTALGSGAVAADHGTGTTDMIVNVCYGTSATPPTASDTTEGTIYLQYTA